MTPFRSLARVVCLLLLLLAAGDLLIAGACDDGAVPTATVAAFSQHDDGDTGHAGDDCYCCSRTVRAETSMVFAPAVQVLERRADQVPSMSPGSVRVLYHPPLV